MANAAAQLAPRSIAPRLGSAAMRAFLECVLQPCFASLRTAESRRGVSSSASAVECLSSVTCSGFRLMQAVCKVRNPGPALLRGVRGVVGGRETDPSGELRACVAAMEVFAES